MSRLFRSFSILFRRAWVLAVIGLVCAREIPPSYDLNFEVAARVGRLQFDFIGWTLNALGLKLAQASSTEQNYLGTEARKQVVLDYFDLLDQSQDLERQIDTMFADPDQRDPAAASRDIKASLGLIRTRMDELSPLAEAVLQEQIAAVLADGGFALGGQIVPPVSFHITALPGFLVISPRDHIALASYANL